MNKKVYIIAGAIIMALAIIAGSCISSTNEQKTESDKTDKGNVSESIGEKPLNLSVYLDLSDRLIKGNGAVTQVENDTALINCIFETFLERCKKSILKNKDHFQIFFYPQPKQDNINQIVKELNLDLRKTALTQKKKAVTDFQSSYKDHVASIYNSTIKLHDFIGSDIWGFFSNKKVDQYCIREGYRNVLIIITDGYIFHVNNKKKDGKAYSYILQQTLSVPGSSLIVARDGLENLEVLMLEINPSPKDHDEMLRVLSKWFEDMGVSKYLINETDIAANTEAVISSFLKR